MAERAVPEEVMAEARRIVADFWPGHHMQELAKRVGVDESVIRAALEAEKKRDSKSE